MSRMRALLGIFFVVAGMFGSSSSVPIVVQAQGPLTASVPGTCVVTQQLRLRSGPGVNYEILARMDAGTNLVPDKRNADATWAYVLVLGTNLRGWISWSAEWIACNGVRINDLAVADATPAGPVGGGGDGIVVSGGAVPDAGAGRDLVGVVFAQGRHTYNSDDDNELLTFRGDFSVQLVVWDPRAGDSDGDGIRRVEFRIENDEGDVLYEKVETSHAYCIFGGAAPCGLQRFSDLPNGSYQVEIVAIPMDENQNDERWRFDFDLRR